MDFFEHQERARRGTRSLVIYFILAVAGIIGAVYAAIVGIFNIWLGMQQGGWWDPVVFTYTAGGTLLVILLGSATRTVQLSAGGGAVATMLGGQPLDLHTTDPDERRLLNVVEEMAIAAGVPVPDVYLLADEHGINAFAAGHAPGDAVVGVTRGCMRLLTRDELQGVIAHEFSHILNGDMRLNVRLIGLLAGILLIATIGEILLRATRWSDTSSSREGKKGGNPLPLLGLALILIGTIGVFFARLIQSAVSRQREFLADASAVQFTRNPDGIAGALKKIGGLNAGSRLVSAHAAEAGHLFFGSALSGGWSALFSTHPPLTERIRAIDPSFAGEFAAFESPAVGVGNLSAAGFVGRTGELTPRDLGRARALQAALPEPLVLAAREPFGASAAMHALLLSQNASMQEAQLLRIERECAPGLAAEVVRLLPVVTALPPTERLGLVDLVLPALRQLSPDQFRNVRASLRAVVESDAEMNLFEWALERVLERHLDAFFVRATPPAIRFRTLDPLVEDTSALLSILAHAGQSSPVHVADAFEQGVRALNPTHPRPALLDREACGLERVGEALERIAAAAPAVKKNLLYACAKTVRADGEIIAAEADLLRAIADTLGCPMPPAG